MNPRLEAIYAMGLRGGRNEALRGIARRDPEWLKRLQLTELKLQHGTEDITEQENTKGGNKVREVIINVNGAKISPYFFRITMARIKAPLSEVRIHPAQWAVYAPQGFPSPGTIPVPKTVGGIPVNILTDQPIELISFMGDDGVQLGRISNLACPSW